MANLVALQRHYIQLAVNHNIMAKGWNNWNRRRKAIENKITKAKLVARVLEANKARRQHGFGPSWPNAKTPKALANKMKENYRRYINKQAQIAKNLKNAENKLLRAANYLPGGPKHNKVLAGRAHAQRRKEAQKLERNLAPPSNRNPRGGSLYRSGMRRFSVNRRLGRNE